MIHCPSCLSIWLRPAEPSFHTEGDATWCRRFICGGCGIVFIMRLTRIAQGKSDHDNLLEKNSPPPPAMVENGGGH